MFVLIKKVYSWSRGAYLDVKKKTCLINTPWKPKYRFYMNLSNKQLIGYFRTFVKTGNQEKIPDRNTNKKNH